MLELNNLAKRYGDAYAVRETNLTIHKGEFFCLLGSSGCGKTTILRMIAGFEKPSAGRILIDGTDVTDLPPYRRNVNTVFQDYALFPHLSVAQNVGYGLRIQKVPAAETKRRVAETLDLVGLTDYGARMPDQLSGGQQQRVALSRALITRPSVLLLDEPMSALDKKIAEQTRVELVDLQRRVGITFVYVTHNQTEALAMADRVAVMRAGVVEQCTEPSDVYERPATHFVADFIGSMNFFEAAVARRGAGSCELMLENRWPIALDRELDVPDDRPLWFCLRPEQLKMTLVAPKAYENQLQGVLRKKIFEGDLTLYHLDLPDGKPIVVSLHNYLARHVRDFFEIGETFGISFNKSSGVAIPR